MNINKEIFIYQKCDPKLLDLSKDDMRRPSPTKTSYIKNWLIPKARKLSKPNPPLILDLGCRTGYYTELLNSLGCIAIGLEALPQYVDVGVKRGRDVRQGDAMYCDEYFEEAYFDGVLAYDIIEHLFDPRPAFINLRKVVKPGAPCLIHTPKEGKGVHLELKDASKPSKHRCVFPTHVAWNEALAPGGTAWKISVLTEDWFICLVAA